jgi:Asp-tRNA(Asn)/Glu-tRNA(Gln) amidotransferase A subunit family amidase
MTLTAGAGSESLGRLDLDRHIVASVVAFTRIWNPVGVPAVSVPIGFTDGSVPVGMQLVARPGADAFLLDVAAQYQQVTRWHHIEPTLLSEEL